MAKNTHSAKAKSHAPAKSHAHAKAHHEAEKHVGDVLGISRARVPAHVPRATKDRSGNPKGIELKRRTTSLRPARVVGGVRSHHR
jgi:hypothetical protein